MDWKRLAFGDLVVLIVGVLGIGGSVALLVLRPHDTPAIVLLTLLSLGIVCIIVRFLDGVDSAQFKMGDIFKVGGSAAIIFAALYFFNEPLENQLLSRRPEALRPLTASSLSGRWVWQWAGDRLLADLKFVDTGGNVTFDGVMWTWTADGRSRTEVFRINGGRATVAGADLVALSFDAVYPSGRSVRLESDSPLTLQRSLQGGLREVQSRATWGIGLQKER